MSEIETSTGLFRAARKLTVVCALAIAIAATVSAQTNTFPSSGNAGIGTTSFDAATSGLQIQPASRGKFGVLVTDIDGSRAAGLSIDSEGYGHIYLYDSGGTLRIHMAASSQDHTYFNNGGNVGIGTSSPNQKLSVVGTGAFYNSTPVTPSGVRGLFMGNYAVGSSIWSYDYATGQGDPLFITGQDINLGTYVGGNSASRLYISNAGHVGIGTTNPVFDPNNTRYLALDGGGNFGSFGVGGNITNTSYPVGQYAFFNTALTGSEKRVATIVGLTDSGTNNGRIDFWTAAAGNFTTPKMSILSNGSVGIGTTTPIQKLDVAGTGLFRGTTLTGNTGAGLYILDQHIISLNGVNARDLSVQAQNVKFFTGSTYAEKMRIDLNGNVGIGLTNPGYKLDVNGEINATGIRINGTPISTGGSSQWSGTNPIYYNSGNVGIGTATPDTWAKLHVQNASHAGVDIQSTNTGAWSRLRLVTSTRAYGWFSGDASSGDAPNKIGLYDYMAGAFRMMIDSAGNVGVGTNNPSQKFEISDSSPTTLFGKVKNANSLGTVAWMAENDNAKQTEVGVRGSSRAAYGSLTANDVYLYGNSSMTFMGDSPSAVMKFATGGNAERVRIDATGNVGIGTVSPGYKLDIQGGQINSAGGLCIAGDCKTAWSQVGGGGSQWTTSGSNIHYTGGVGIGTPSPGYQLDVQANSQWAARFKKTDATNGGILIESGAGYNPNLALAVNGTIKWYLNSNVAQSDSLQFWESTGSNPRFTLTQAGNLGVGTATPAERLHVAGNGKVTGNLTVDGTVNAKYQDLAEWVPSSEQLAAGTVVVLDTTKSNQVVSSAAAYDTRVAGVISAQPGIALGEGGEGKVLVATTGRVRVKVDASHGPIQIGDLLVTSDVSGVAMKSEAVNLGGVQIHRPGTIIGKALEPLAKGRGEILVLLSLQ